MYVSIFNPLIYSLIYIYIYSPHVCEYIQPSYIFPHIYIYIYMLSSTDQNSSVWLDPQDAQSRDRNPSNFTID